MGWIWTRGCVETIPCEESGNASTSYSNPLARPNFGDIAFRRLVNDEDDEITVGNPFMETLEARWPIPMITRCSAW